MSSPRRAGTHVRPRRRPALVKASVVVPACAVVASALLVVALLSGSPWPAAALPVLGVALGGLLLGRAATAVSVAVLVAGGAGALLLTAPAGSVLDPAAALSLLVAGLAAAGAGAVWRHQRRLAVYELDGERQRSQALSVVDELTGCYNSGGLHLLGEQVLHLVRRQSGAMHCALVEVDGIGPVLDALGPAAVDDVLIAVSDALRGVTRGSDVVSRHGEVSFVVVGPGAGLGALDLERRLRGRLLQAPPLSLRDWPCTLLVGVGQLQPWDSGGINEIIARAEEDLGLRRALRAPMPVAQPVSDPPVG